MSKKRSLADELAELFNPAPTKELDLDADPFGGGPALVESDEELAADVQHTSRRAKEKTFRLRGDIQLDDSHYKGRRTSRKAAFGGLSDSEGGSGSVSEGVGSEEMAGASSASDAEEDDGDLGLGGLEDGTNTDSDEEPPGAHEGRQQQEQQQKRQQQQQQRQRGRSRGEASQGNGYAAHLASDDGTAGLGNASDRNDEGAPGGDGSELPNGGPGSDLEELGSEEEMGEGDGSDGSAGGQSSDEERRNAAGASSDDEGAEQGGRPGSAGAANDEMEELEREYEAMRAAEAEAAAGLRERAQREQQKALAVKAQAQLWGRGLELRILLQRALQGANRLPQAAAHSTAAAASVELLGGFNSLAKEAVGLLGDLSEVAGALYQQNPAVTEAVAGALAGQKRQREGAGAGELSSDQLWAELDGLYCGFVPFRDAAVDRWHRKTTLTTGSAVRSSLKALNQSVSSQVATMMRDPHKLLQRTRLLRSHSKPLGGSVDLAAEQAEAVILEASGIDTSKPGAPAAYEGDDERDPETFDDTEFYQTLLKEFLEGSGAAANGGGNWFSGPKQRKVVDRRASKGRKIRYHVHEKLVNFMTPMDQDAPMFASQLFSNLFGGQRGT